MGDGVRGGAVRRGGTPGILAVRGGERGGTLALPPRRQPSRASWLPWCLLPSGLSGVVSGCRAGVPSPPVTAPGQLPLSLGQRRGAGSSGKEGRCGECDVWRCSPAHVGGFTSQATKTQSWGWVRCCCQLSGACSFQNLKIQRSVGRAKDGTTFPLSLKLKSEPGSEMVEDGRAVPERGYSASVWVFSTISGLITLLPDGTIYGINHSFALMLFGYGKTELLGKVGLAWVASLRAPAGGWSISTVRTCACHRPRTSLSAGPTPWLPLGGAGQRAPCLHSFLWTPRRALHDPLGCLEVLPWEREGLSP